MNISTKFSSDWLSGYHFILSTSNFLFINVTSITLGQGHQKVIQYIFPDLYFLCPKQFWQAKQKSVRRRTRRKRTENIKSPQTGVT